MARTILVILPVNLIEQIHSGKLINSAANFVVFFHQMVDKASFHFFHGV